MNDVINSKPGTSPEQATVRLERMLPGPIERVWAYLTDSEKRATWFAGGVFDLRVGGKADLHFDHSCISSEKTPDEYKSKKSDWPSTITRVEAPRLLSYTFGPAGPGELSTVDPQETFSWRSGRLVYRAQPLADVVADLNRQFVEQTEIDDPELARTPITGVIVLDNPRAVVSRLSLMLPMRAVPSEKGLMLRKK